MNPGIDIHVLAARYLSGEMSIRQQKKFLHRLEKQAEEKAEFLKLEKDWEAMFSHSPDIESETNKSWNHLLYRLENDGLLPQPKETVSFIPGYAWRLAAAILVMIIVTVPALIYFQGKKGTLASQAFTAIEQTTSYDLPDGSRVFLKKGSEILLVAHFEKNRSLTLRGEAFFDVMADPSHPFRITAGEAIVSVVGTEFNVKEDQKAGHTEIFVESGSVIVQGRRNSREIILEPGEFALTTRQELSRKNLSDPNYLAWKTRIFEFRNKPLSEVFALLEDVYQVKILVEDERINDLRLTSSYHKQSAEAVLNTIGAAFGLNIAHESENYEVSFNP